MIENPTKRSTRREKIESSGECPRTSLSIAPSLNPETPVRSCTPALRSIFAAADLSRFVHVLPFFTTWNIFWYFVLYRQSEPRPAICSPLCPCGTTRTTRRSGVISFHSRADRSLHSTEWPSTTTFGPNVLGPERRSTKGWRFVGLFGASQCGVGDG